MGLVNLERRPLLIDLRLRLKEDPSILVIYASLIPMVETVESFWLALGKLVGEKTKSSDEFETMFLRRKTRLWLAIDELDMMFKNEDLTSNFMHRLRLWQSSEYFLGFLGIGSHDLLNMHMKFKGGGTGIGHEWEDWFKIKSFFHYLNNYNWTYRKIRKDPQELSQPDLVGCYRHLVPQSFAAVHVRFQEEIRSVPLDLLVGAQTWVRAFMKEVPAASGGYSLIATHLALVGG
ncbi:hypothetical protein P3T76_011557 [Phytophthora citrophthora]|uniref:Uncharacterized protein n=1 Tax=Phytophthora citrophthora TaxID=4793 RepID=A0AAD9G8J0_9STRA|nr:hypothetical protein P3T76_011557 [Phytophthora citrophthora]